MGPLSGRWCRLCATEHLEHLTVATCVHVSMQTALSHPTVPACPASLPHCCVA